MSLTVITGWSPAGWIQYGRRFAESFDAFWPADVELLAYTEEPCDMPRGRCLPVLEIPGCAEFLARHGSNPLYCGRGVMPGWKASALAAGYNFRYDAVKFCRQGFIPNAAARLVTTRFMAWFDGDVVFHAVPKVAALCSLLPRHLCVGYLGRKPKWSEIGFQLYRLPEAAPVLAEFARLYREEAILDLPEWHSAYAFDTALSRFPGAGHDLTPGGRGHVWRQSPLACFSDHLKGERKNA